MEIRELLINIWTTNIKERFTKGLMIYERQCQAELFHQLKSIFPYNYEVWVEPIIYLPKESGLNKTKPDLIITDGDKVVSVIEIKFKPWEFAHYKYDLEKLRKFERIYDSVDNIILGFIPKSQEWEKQSKIQQTKINYQINNNILYCFINCSKYYQGDGTFYMKENKPKNFLHLNGYIDKDGKINFYNEDYK